MSNGANSRWARGVLAAAAALIVLAVAGCGSSSSGLSKAALQTKGDAICKKHTDVITAAASKLLAGGKLPSPAKFGKLAFGTIIPQYTAQIGELSALKPEAKLATSYKQWLTASRAVVAGMKRNPVSIQSSAPYVAVNNEAKALGLSSCHAGPG
ncbi:MAG: hypothetical protein M3Z06_01840 [Actinomycetota bacterium]|nr:hypothetical protein [Actinomycetota bacterium]